MLPDRVSNPGPLTYESGALPIALRGPATIFLLISIMIDNMENLIRYTKPFSGLKIPKYAFNFVYSWFKFYLFV